MESTAGRNAHHSTVLTRSYLCIGAFGDLFVFVRPHLFCSFFTLFQSSSPGDTHTRRKHERNVKNCPDEIDINSTWQGHRSKKWPVFPPPLPPSTFSTNKERSNSSNCARDVADKCWPVIAREMRSKIHYVQKGWHATRKCNAILLLIEKERSFFAVRLESYNFHWIVFYLF